MNILFLTNTVLNYNNAPSSRVLNLEKELSRDNKIYVLSIQSSESLNGKNYFTLRKNDSNFLHRQAFKLMMIFKAIQLIMDKRIKAVVVRSYYYILMLYLFKLVFKFKIIYDMHCFRYQELSDEGKKLKSRIVAPIERFSHLLVDYFMIVSPGLLDKMNDRYRRRSFLVPNAVNLDEFKDIKMDQRMLQKYGIIDEIHLVGYSGSNWMGWVDIPTLLESTKYFDKNVKLIIMGKGDDRREVERLKKKYPEVIFTGHFNHFDLLNMLDRIELCILPYKKLKVVNNLSVRKTFEYLAAGKPLVLADVKIQERNYLKENENYFLYEAENPKDLADKINKLILKPRVLAKMRKNNLKVIKNFTWRASLERSGILKLLN